MKKKKRVLRTMSSECAYFSLMAVQLVGQAMGNDGKECECNLPHTTRRPSVGSSSSGSYSSDFNLRTRALKEE